MENAERRALMLVNPDFGGKSFTTTNLFAGIQILEPGESAVSHRHTPSAMRFVIEGGGITSVNGEPCPMEPGDLILTPNWAWHEHSNPADRRSVWLDALDIPLAQNLGPMFMEHGGSNAREFDLSAIPDRAFAVAGYVPDTDAPATPYSPMFRYPWTQTLAALEAAPAAPDGARRVRYTNPVDGGPVIRSMDCYAWELARGRETRPVQDHGQRHRDGGRGRGPLHRRRGDRRMGGARRPSPCRTGTGFRTAPPATSPVCSSTPTARCSACSTSCARSLPTDGACRRRGDLGTARAGRRSTRIQPPNSSDGR